MEYDKKTGEFLTTANGSTKDGIRRIPSRRTRRNRIERMLQNEFATVDEIRETFVRLKALALGGVQTIVEKDGTTTCVIDPKPQFMAMWLDRLIGPVRNDEQVEKAVEKRLAEMLDLAEREARKRSESITARVTSSETSDTDPAK